MTPLYDLTAHNRSDKEN